MNIMSCQICSSNDLVKILDLGMHPPPLKFLKNNEPEQLFPLQLFFCNSCNLWQLGNAVEPSILFKTYTYESGVSNSFKNHLHNFAKLLVDRFHLTTNDLVIDIASNDGTLLVRHSGRHLVFQAAHGVTDVTNECLFPRCGEDQAGRQEKRETKKEWFLH